MTNNIDIFNKIHMNFKVFTKAELKVADFVCNNAQEVLYMSITDLADKCSVGDTSVFRFCRTLKFSGYQDFKMALAQSLSTGNNNLTLSGEIDLKDSLDIVCKKMLNTTISALNSTMDMLNLNDIEKSVEYISLARRIYFFGTGSSGITAAEARSKFGRIIPNVDCLQDPHMQSMAAALMDSQDLTIAFSYSGSTKDTIEILKTAKSNHAKTICITHFIKSPLTNYADIVLLCGANEGPFQGGSLSAKISQLYLIDILYTEFFKKHYDFCRANKEKTTEAIVSRLL